MDKFILTQRKVYTPMEVIDLFSEYVTADNVGILVDHLTEEDLAPNIISFSQINDIVYFNIGLEELIKVTKK